MDLKRVIILSLAAIAGLASIVPANAWLWPPTIGSCGLGGLWGIYGPFGPFGGAFWGCGCW